MRRMSFALTEPQLLDGSKDVTRRLGWAKLVAGEQVVAVRKAMGLRKGESQVVLGTLRIVSVVREPLFCITQNDCRREGFPLMTPNVFVTFFCGANGCSPKTEVTRIEFAFTPLRPNRRSPTP